MKRSAGIIHLIPLIIIGALIAGLVIATLNVSKITNFLNKAAENIAISSPPEISPGPAASPSSPEDWRACISTPGAKILQTFPSICVYPDGRKITEPTTNTNQCGGIQGIICPAGETCIYSDGTDTAPFPDASGTCQTKPTSLPNSAPGTLPVVSTANPSYGPPSSPFVIPTTLPNPTCAPMPPCVNSNPRCLLPEPAEGWCPATPGPSVRPTTIPNIPVSSSPIPLFAPTPLPTATTATIIDSIINSVANFLQGLFGR